MNIGRIYVNVLEEVVPHVIVITLWMISGKIWKPKTNQYKSFARINPYSLYTKCGEKNFTEYEGRNVK
jgi:hypothetical protein